MLLEIMTICMLTHTSPFYDCSRKLIIELYDDEFIDIPCQNHNEKIRVMGCAYFSRNPIDYIYYNPMIKVGSSHHIDKWGQTNLQHELRHIKCKCNWDGHP